MKKNYIHYLWYIFTLIVQPNHRSLFLILLIVICFLSPQPAVAMKVGDLSVGSVILLDEAKFIKINNQGLFIAIDPYGYYLGEKPTTLQAMSQAYCQSLIPCSIGKNCDTNGSTVILTDSRDGKSYRVRKFPDGNCWMIDNLAYGGDTDAIAGKTTFSGNGQTTPYITWYSGSVQLYGDARDPAVPPYCTESDSCPDPDFCANHNCGYYYSWQAAVQNSLAYSGNIYQPTEPVTGICPSGWQLPTNFGQSSFINLHSAMGFTANKIDGTDNWTCLTGCTNFWQQSDLWAGLFSGDLGNIGDIYNQGGSGYFWTSTQYSDTYSYYMAYDSVKSYPVYAIDKGDGFSVRCVLQ